MEGRTYDGKQEQEKERGRGGEGRGGGLCYVLASIREMHAVI